MYKLYRLYVRNDKFQIENYTKSTWSFFTKGLGRFSNPSTLINQSKLKFVVFHSRHDRIRSKGDKIVMNNI